MKGYVPNEGGNRNCFDGSAPIADGNPSARALSESGAFLIRTYRIACQRGSRVALGLRFHTVDVIASLDGSGRSSVPDLLRTPWRIFE